MPGFDDALRGYAYPIHKRDAFRCRYCGLDGTESFASWLSLSWDHLLPKGDPRRDDPEYIVTSCMFCNVADNRYFDLAEKRGLHFDELTPDQLEPVEAATPGVAASCSWPRTPVMLMLSVVGSRRPGGQFSSTRPGRAAASRACSRSRRPANRLRAGGQVGARS